MYGVRNTEYGIRILSRNWVTVSVLYEMVTVRGKGVGHWDLLLLRFSTVDY